MRGSGAGRLPSLSIIHRGAQLPLFRADARQYNAGLRHFAQRLHQIIYLRLIGRFQIRPAQHQRRLRLVGHDHIRLLAKRFHQLRHFFRHSGVQLPVIPHHRIHDDLGLLSPKRIEQLLYQRHLLRRTQITSIDGIKCQVQRFPVRKDSGQVLG